MREPVTRMEKGREGFKKILTKSWGGSWSIYWYTMWKRKEHVRKGDVIAWVNTVLTHAARRAQEERL